MPAHRRMRAFERDLIRGGHYGQRSCEPHLKAEHMAALTKADANVKKLLPTRSRPHMALFGQSRHRNNLSAFGAERTSVGRCLGYFLGPSEAVEIIRPVLENHGYRSHNSARRLMTVSCARPYTFL